MADLNTLSLIVNVADANKVGLLQDFNSRIPASVPLFIRNDVIEVSLRAVQPTLSQSLIWEDVDLSTSDVVLGIGEFDETPTSGAFPLTFGANTATGLAYNVSASALSTALNALASIISAGGVTVAALGTGVYSVTFVTAGVRSLMTSGTNTLLPSSTVVISRAVTGDVSTAEVQIIRLAGSLYAACDTWTPFPTAAGVVTVLAAGSGSTQNVQVITLNPVPYAGTFAITTSLITTPAIPYNATAQQVQDALNDAGTTTDYTVTGSAGGPWTITKTAVGSVADNTVDASGLIVPLGLTGELSLSTYEMLQRFASVSDNAVTLVMEIQVTPVGLGEATILQIPVTVSKDVINYSGITPLPVANYYTSTQVDALLAQRVNNSIHSLATLAAYATTSIAVNDLLFFVNDTDAPFNTTNVIQGWQLRASTAATVTGSIQRPSDYNAGTNAKVWFRIFAPSGIVGSNTNDSAAAGDVGEAVSSYIASGSAVSLSNATAANVTSVSLTAGDWDVEGNVNFIASAATVTASSGGISATSATVPTNGSEVFSGVLLTVGTATYSATSPRVRISIASTTTIYLVGKASFSAGTVTAFGGITARRVR